MHITQHDIARVSDDNLKLMILATREQIRDMTESGAHFWRLFNAALVGAVKERQVLLAVAELELSEGLAQEGAIVDAHVDAVAEALLELRHERRL